MVNRVFGWVDGVLDRIFCLIGAFVILQLPLFIHEYTLVLKGHIDELGFHIQLIRDAAARSDKTLEEYIQKFMKSGDLDFMRQGEIMQTLNGRLHDMTYSLNAIQESSVWSRPFVLFSNWQSEIAHSTWGMFQFGLPLTLEGFVYAFVGLVLGFCFYHLLTSFFRPNSVIPKKV